MIHMPHAWSVDHSLSLIFYFLEDSMPLMEGTYLQYQLWKFETVLTLHGLCAVQMYKYSTVLGLLLQIIALCLPLCNIALLFYPRTLSTQTYCLINPSKFEPMLLRELKLSLSFSNGPLRLGALHSQLCISLPVQSSPVSGLFAVCNGSVFFLI